MTELIVGTDDTTRADIVAAPHHRHTHGSTHASTPCSPSSTAMRKTCRHCGRSDAHCAEHMMACCPLCEGQHG